MATIMHEDERDYQEHRQQFLSFAHGLFTVAGLILFVLLLLYLFLGGDSVVPT